MANRGALNWNPSSSTTYTVQPGYYSGGTLNSSGAYNAGVNAGRGLKSKTFTITSSSSRATFHQGNRTATSLNYITLNLGVNPHTIVSAWFKRTSVSSGGTAYWLLTADGSCGKMDQNYFIDLKIDQPNWNTAETVKIPCYTYASESITITVWYV